MKHRGTCRPVVPSPYDLSRIYHASKNPRLLDMIKAYFFAEPPAVNPPSRVPPKKRVPSGSHRS